MYWSKIITESVVIGKNQRCIIIIFHMHMRQCKKNQLIKKLEGDLVGDLD